MPVKKCSNGKWQIGNGPCMYTSKEKAEKAYVVYRAQKHDINDAKRGKYSNCVKQRLWEGYSRHEAELSCTKWLVDEIDSNSDDFNVIFVDAIDLSGVLKRSKSLSMSRFSTLIKTLKTRVGLKVGHMGMLPQKVELPMKNLNRLQTKMEKLITAEAKWLTAEQYEQRKQYARYMRKTDSEEMSDEEFTNSMIELYNTVIDYYPDLTPEEAIDRAFEPLEGDNAWIMSNEAEIISMNDGLNNIIKAPIILAKEMVQRYTNEKGEDEYHFKPYDELKMAAEIAEENGPLDIIIEHQDSYNEESIIGQVKEIRACDPTRTIRGTGYFNEAKLPDALKRMIKDGEIIPVSIGFLAILGDGGDWNGVKYQHTQTNIHLRHLAVILDSVARCPPDVCGINLEDANNVDKEENIKNFTIINKDSYYYNISDIVRNNNTEDSKKETNKKNIIEKNSKKIETMHEDLKEDDSYKDQPDDFNAIMSKLQKHIQNEPVDLRKQIIKKILAALGIKNKSDSKMDEKEFQDAIAKKESEIDTLKKEFEDAKTRIKEFEEKEKLNYIKTIKKFGDKYSDEELMEEDLKSLEKIADAVSRFAPSNEDPEVIPVAAKPNKEEMEKKIEKGERIDFSRVFDDVKKEFNMSGL